MARASERRRRILLMLIIVPFWTSFLIRIFAWKSLLHPEGLVKKALVALGLAGPETSLLYNAGAVLLVMVYTYLPFAILPIYAAAEKFDFRLIEAARDLGARPFQAFRRVFLPGIRRGLLTAVLVVFIPALGSYVIPDLVGGPSSEMIGNKIAQRVFVDRNLPHASALSASSSWPCWPRSRPSSCCARRRSRGSSPRRTHEAQPLPAGHDRAGPALLLPAHPDPGRQLLQRLALRRLLGGLLAEVVRPALPRAGDLDRGPQHPDHRRRPSPWWPWSWAPSRLSPCTASPAAACSGSTTP